MSRYESVHPKLLRRLSGGWLAVSEDGAALRIGVEGDTEEEAARRFYEARREWDKLWEEDDA